MNGNECVRKPSGIYLVFTSLSNLRGEQRQITCWSIKHDVILQKKEKRRGVGWRNKICHALSILPPPTHFSQNIHVYTRCVRLTFWFVSMVTRRIDLLWSLAGNCAVRYSVASLGVSRSVTLFNYLAFNTPHGLACTTLLRTQCSWPQSTLRVLKNPSLVPILRQMNPILIFTFPATHMIRPLCSV